MALLAIHGGPFTDRVGDFQTVSNIEAVATARLFEFGYEQAWSEQWDLVIGLLALDSDFDLRSSAGLFVHSPATPRT